MFKNIPHNDQEVMVVSISVNLFTQFPKLASDFSLWMYWKPLAVINSEGDPEDQRGIQSTVMSKAAIVYSQVFHIIVFHGSLPGLHMSLSNASWDGFFFLVEWCCCNLILVARQNSPQWITYKEIHNPGLSYGHLSPHRIYGDELRLVPDLHCGNAFSFNVTE